MNRGDFGTAIVTGASSGIGLAIAEALLRSGARVVLSARNPERLHTVATRLQPGNEERLLVHPCDVSRRPEVDALMGKTVERFGRIDILVNNAGLGLLGPLECARAEDAHTIFETNFFGVFHCCQAVLSQMKKQGGGHIVNVASVAGLYGMPNGIYSASKAALISLSQCLRLETKRHNIQVTVICPGRLRLSDTRFFQSAIRRSEAKLCGLPEDLTVDAVAQATVRAILKRKKMVVLPWHAKVFDWITRASPALAEYMIAQRMPNQDADRATSPVEPKAESYAGSS